VIHDVLITRRAEKQLRSVPQHIARALQEWVSAVKIEGLEAVRRLPGYHDEPLQGQRKHQRSIRLSRSYRAIYEIQSDGAVEFVSIEEVNKHDY
jgi:proteic killer suppression protein